MNKTEKKSGFQCLTVLVPEGGSYPHFLLSGVLFAKAAHLQVKVLTSDRFAKERPRKMDFYRTILEEQLGANGTPWLSEPFDYPLWKTLGDLSPDRDLVAVSKGDLNLLKSKLFRLACSILVIPKSFNQEFKKVLLAYVGGRYSDRALEVAVLLNKFAQCQIQVITVGTSSSPALRVAQLEARYFLDFWKVNAKYQVLLGSAREKILEVSKQEKTSLLVLGATETREWKDHRFRGISETVVEEADCPVLIVRS